MPRTTRRAGSDYRDGGRTGKPCRLARLLPRRIAFRDRKPSKFLRGPRDFGRNWPTISSHSRDRRGELTRLPCQVGRAQYHPFPESLFAPFFASFLTPTSKAMTLTDNATIMDLNIKVTLTHTRYADLKFELIGPDNVTPRLLCAAGAVTGSGTKTLVFDDDGAAGTIRPVYALSNYDGKSTQGKWTLKITDTVKNLRPVPSRPSRWT